MTLPWPFVRRPSLLLGRTGGRVMGLPYFLGPRELAAHKHLIGVSGTGKSALMANLFVQLQDQGIAACLIDPHSDLARDCLGALVDHGFFARSDAFTKLRYVDFRRTDAYLPFNVLAQPYPDHTVADWLVEVCLRAWPALAEGVAPTFENLIRHSVVLLRQNGRLPLTHLAWVLTNKPYRDHLLRAVRDPQVHRFFTDRVDRWGREGARMLESTLNRADLLTFHPTLRYSLGQRTNALDFRRLLDGGISLIVDLGGLPEQVQRFLGAVICHGFEVAALARADTPPERRTPYHLILDEFPMFSSQSERGLTRILGLCRKYGLLVTMAHQTFSQLSVRMSGALQNAITIGFRMGRADAEWAARRFGRFDEGEIKHEVADPAALERTHPLYATLAEQTERWTRAIEDLGRGEAFVRTEHATAKIRTRILPPARTPSAVVDDIATRHGNRLLVPAGTVVPAVDRDLRAVARATPLPRRARIR